MGFLAFSSLLASFVVFRASRRRGMARSSSQQFNTNKRKLGRSVSAFTTSTASGNVTSSSGSSSSSSRAMEQMEEGRAAAGDGRPGSSQGRPTGSLDEVEDAVKDFIPAIVALRELGSQLLRDQLPKALANLKRMDKPEIAGYLQAVGGEVRAMVQKLSAFRQTAQALREKEIRERIRSAPLKESDNSLQEVPGLPAEVRDMQLTRTGGSSSSSVGPDPVGSMDLENVFVVGMSHQTGNVSLREKLAVPEKNWNKWSKNLVDYATQLNGGRSIITGAAIISTCNRFEVIFSANRLNGFAARELVFKFLEAQSGLSVDELKPYLMMLDGDKASWHLFRVAAGLESLVLGENQILSQVSRCHQLGIMQPSQENGNVGGSAGKVIARLLQMTITAARQVRSQTALGEGKVSVSSAAVQLAQEKSQADVGKPLIDANVAILGNGKMAKIICAALARPECTPNSLRVFYYSDKAKAEKMLQDAFDGAGDLDEDQRKSVEAKVSLHKLSTIDDGALADCDIIFSAASSPTPIVTPKLLQHPAMGKSKRMFVDIAVPRNVATECRSDHTAVYDVDALQAVVDVALSARKAAAGEAESMLQEEHERFKQWQWGLMANPALTRLEGWLKKLREKEVSKADGKLRGMRESDRKNIDRLLQRILGQIMTSTRKSIGRQEELPALQRKVWALRELFGTEKSEQLDITTAAKRRLPSHRI